MKKVKNHLKGSLIDEASRPKPTKAEKQDALESLDYLLRLVEENCRMSDIGNAQSFGAGLRRFIESVPTGK